MRARAGKFGRSERADARSPTDNRQADTELNGPPRIYASADESYLSLSGQFVSWLLSPVFANASGAEQ